MGKDKNTFYIRLSRQKSKYKVQETGYWLVVTGGTVHALDQGFNLFSWKLAGFSPK